MTNQPVELFNQTHYCFIVLEGRVGSWDNIAHLEHYVTVLNRQTVCSMWLEYDFIFKQSIVHDGRLQELVLPSTCSILHVYQHHCLLFQWMNAFKYSVIYCVCNLLDVLHVYDVVIAGEVE